MGTSSTWILLLLGLSTFCSALPRRGVVDFPKPVLPESLEKAGALIINNAEQEAATRSIAKPALLVQNVGTSPVVLPIFAPTLFASNSILDSVKNVVNAIKFVQKINAPFAASSGDNGFMKKIGEYWESFKIVKQIRDKCSDDKTKDDVSCTTMNVHGFYDLFGETWHKILYFGEKWFNPIRERITEIKDDKEDYKTTNPGGTTVVTKSNTYFSSFIKFLDMMGLDGKPEVTYIKDKENEEKEQDGKTPQELKEKTPQELKEDALLAANSGIHSIETHNYWTKSVNAAIKLAGLGIFGALCAQNCGIIENLLGFGTPPPPIDPVDEAANQLAAAADAAGDTDGDNDVDGDDGRRRDTIVDDSYQGYDHNGEYLGYDLQQPQVQPEQKNYLLDGQDPGYAFGTFPGWYPPEVNINNINSNNNNNNNNNNNHLLEPKQHPDFSSRLLHSRDYHPQPIHEVAPRLPRPVYRGGRMLLDTK